MITESPLLLQNKRKILYILSKTQTLKSLKLSHMLTREGIMGRVSGNHIKKIHHHKHYIFTYLAIFLFIIAVIVFYFAVLGGPIKYTDEEANALCSTLNMQFTYKEGGYTHCAIGLLNGVIVEHVYRKINQSESTLYLVNINGYK